MIDDRVIGSRRLGGMVLTRELLAPGRETELVRADGRPQADFRVALRRIPSLRNALSVVGLYTQTALILWATIRFGPWAWPIGFVLMVVPRPIRVTDAEAAHPSVRQSQATTSSVVAARYPTFVDRRVPPGPHGTPRHDSDGEPTSRSTSASIALQPASQARARPHRRPPAASARRRVDSRVYRGYPDAVEDHAVHAALSRVDRGRLPARVPAAVVPPYPTVCASSTLRSIAEHAARASSDPRVTTPSVSQHPVARFLLVPYTR